MKLQQLQYLHKSWTVHMHSDGFDRMQCQLVLAFGEPGLITDTSVFNHLERSYPEAHIILCSAPAAMLHKQASGNSVMVTAVEFETTLVHCSETHIGNHTNCNDAGQYLMKKLQQKNMLAAYIISDSTCINDRELIKGWNAVNGHYIPMGVMAGDNTNNADIFTGLNKLPGKGVIVAVGFYDQPSKRSLTNPDHEYIYNLISNRNPYALS